MLVHQNISKFFIIEKSNMLVNLKFPKNGAPATITFLKIMLVHQNFSKKYFLTEKSNMLVNLKFPEKVRQIPSRF